MAEFSISRARNGDPYLGNENDVLHALAEAVKNGTVTITYNPDNRDEPYYRVELLDGDEFGHGETLGEALRYGLGVHFAPEGFYEEGAT